MTEVHTPDEVATVCRNAKSKNLPIFVLGGGSNVVAKDEGFNGIILHMRIPGFEIMLNDTNITIIRIGAGEIWDSVVERIINMGLSGVEAMSAIPGTAGAYPIQNAGAYGQEIADTLQIVEAYDILNDEFVTLRNSDCKFSYRDSIFKNEARGQYVITSITLKLSKNQPQPPFSDALQKYLDEHKIAIYTGQIIRDAVIDIRKNKLPDPKTTPNSGSFFKNTIVEDWQLKDLMAKFPDIPTFDMGTGKHKIPTGWLIEQAGLKGQLFHGMRIHDKNALVLINESATSYKDLSAARDEIISKVYDTFGILIQQEPQEI